AGERPAQRPRPKETYNPGATDQGRGPLQHLVRRYLDRFRPNATAALASNAPRRAPAIWNRAARDSLAPVPVATTPPSRNPNTAPPTAARTTRATRPIADPLRAAKRTSSAAGAAG